MKQHFAGLFVLSFLLGTLLLSPLETPTHAQTASLPIAYGEVLSGEITDDVKRVEFGFDGQAGDIVFAQMVPAIDDGVIGAHVSITDERERILADSSQLIVFGGGLGRMIAAELLQDGKYTLTVFVREDSTQSGGFDVSVLQVQTLESGDVIEGEVTNTLRDTYSTYSAVFAVDSRDDFTVTYEHTGGRYYPDVTVHNLETGNLVWPRAYVGGEELISGSLTMLGAADYRIITVGARSFGTRGSTDMEESGSFRLTVKIDG